MDIEKIRDSFIAKEHLKKKDRIKTSQKVIAQLKGLHSIWQKHNLSNIYLYGSFADASFHSDSDIDIAYEPELSWEKLLALYADVDRHFKQEIDLRSLQDIPFAKKINQHGILIYDRKNCNSQK